MHTGTINIDDTEILLDTTYSDFRPSSFGIIWHINWDEAKEYEIIKIQDIQPDKLVLQDPVGSQHEGSKYIIPIRQAIIDSVVDKSDISSEVASLKVNFIVKDNIYIDTYSADTTYKSLPVLTNDSMQTIDAQKRYGSDADKFNQDYESGDFDVISDSQFNIISQSWNFVNGNINDCWSFREFLHYLRGRFKAIWIPTFRKDFILSRQIGPTDTTFYIENIGLAQNFMLNNLRKHLAFIFPDSTILFREITDINAYDEDEEIITIDSALGVTIDPGDCIISFLDLCRLSTDEIRIEWFGDGLNQCELLFTDVVA